MKENIEKVPPITSYGECTHPNKDCKYRKDMKCPDAPMAIHFCRNCSDEDLQKADEFSKRAFSAYDIQKPQPKEAAHLTEAPALDTNQDERVNHPKHYQHPSGIECITVARHHDFNTGNALKYIFRAGFKQETQKQIEDLQKAIFYLNDEIEFLKSKQQKQ